MELIRADLQMDVKLADGAEDKLTIRNVNPSMSELYISQIAGILKNTFEIDGQSIADVTSLSVIQTNKTPYSVATIV